MIKSAMVALAAVSAITLATPAAAVSFVVQPGQPISFIVTGVGSALSFSWQDSASVPASYTAALLYPAYPDPRYCQASRAGCTPFTVYSPAFFTASTSVASEVFSMPLFYYGNYSLSGVTLQFTATGGAPVNIANLVVTTAGATLTPEPSTWALMLAGFGLMGYTLRKRRVSVALAPTA